MADEEQDAKELQLNEQAIADTIGNDLQARSIKCSDCGKLMANEALAQYHAEKSGHTNFEESTEVIKPLTEEEKKQKLEELRSRLAAKRATQSKEDAQTQKQNEKIRRKAGQDLGDAKEEMKQKQMLRDAEKKKAEVRADIEAKRRVREQIEQDKLERAAKFNRNKQETVHATTPVTSTPASAPVITASHSQARLRVKAPEGVWSGTLAAEDTLDQVEKAVIEANFATRPIVFSTTFPRKTFTIDDHKRTLKDLGLVPNAALEAAYR